MAPVVTDPLEDWVRLPVDHADLQARVTMLVAKLRATEPPRPHLDGGELVRYAGLLAPLPPVEARLAAPLLERFAAVVSRDVLARAGWPAGGPGRNALDVHMVRLRRRLAPLGLTIKTIRGRGYLLDASDSSQKAVH